MNPTPAENRKEKPLQFRLRTLLVMVGLVAVLFSVLAWLRVPPEGQLIVLAILGLGVAAAVGLLVAIGARSSDGGNDEPA